MMNLHRLNTRDPLERLTPGYAFEAWEHSRPTRTPIEATVAGPAPTLPPETALAVHMHNCLSAVYRMAAGYMDKGLSAEGAMFAAMDVAYANVCKRLGLADPGAFGGNTQTGNSHVA